MFYFNKILYLIGSSLHCITLHIHYIFNYSLHYFTVTSYNYYNTSCMHVVSIVIFFGRMKGIFRCPPLHLHFKIDRLPTLASVTAMSRPCGSILTTHSDRDDRRDGMSTPACITVNINRLDDVVINPEIIFEFKLFIHCKYLIECRSTVRPRQDGSQSAGQSSVSQVCLAYIYQFYFTFFTVIVLRLNFIVIV